MIFNFFKSKPTLKELIPKGFIDIHSHIIPGVDDGAKNIDESLKLINEIKNLGFSKSVTTPHTYPGLYENTNESIKEKFNLIKNKYEKIIIEYASEYLIDMSLLKKIDEKSILTIKDNYVLLELSFISAPINLYEIIFYFITNGYSPIIAHPERYTYMFQDFKEFKKLKKVGCKFQLNLLSTTGYYGKHISKISDILLKNNMVDFVGTDIHAARHIESIKKDKIQIESLKELSIAMEKNIEIFK